jgi:hypothetical protein
MRTATTIFLLALLTGCATTGSESAFYARQDATESALAVRMAGLADASACNGDPACVVAVKAIAGLTQAAGGRSAAQQQYVRQPGAAERVTLGLLGALPGFAQVYATVESGKRNVDIARINAEREIGTAGAWAGVTRDVANAFGALPPSSFIGGDVIGRDLISGQQQIGDWRTGDDIETGDINTGTQTRNSGQIGTGNRQASPDNRDTGNVGDRCDGEGCQAPLPLPVEPPEDA